MLRFRLMSTLLRSLSFTFKFAPFFIIFCFIIPFFSVVKADQITADDTKISVTHNPPTVYADTPKVTFEIKATEHMLPVGNYFYRVTILRDGCRVNALMTNSTPGVVITDNLISIPAGIGCRKEAGARRFELWYGSDDSGSKIVYDYPFYVLQVGGGNALEIEPFPKDKKTLGISETPQVIIKNAVMDREYSFWWDSAKTEVPTKFKATYTGDTPPIPIAKDGMPDPNKPGSKILCMEEGNYIVPTGCSYHTEFVFSLFPSASSGGTKTCAINPPNPTENQSVSIVATNLPKNQDFRADFIIKDITIPLSEKRNSGADGAVVLPLAAFLVSGTDYKARVYNDKTSDLVCEESFGIGKSNPEIGLRPTRKQELQVVSCDKDVNNPGLSTAIGCIHTSPIAFAKDFLTFIIAVSGGFAFLMMLLGAFEMITSAGNPESLKKGQDRFTSAIVGLLFVIFSVLLLQIIGADILNLPKFGK